MRGFIQHIMQQRLIVALIFGGLLWVGVASAPFDWDLGEAVRSPIPVDAIPDVGEAQQVISAEWAGRSPEDVEDQVTYPLTVQLLGTPGVRAVRSTSMFGVSLVTAVLDEDADLYWVRTRLSERLASLPRGTFPEGVTPTLGPDATALGQVFWYTLEGRDRDGQVLGGWSLHELRTIQDTLVKPALTRARGIAEIASIGGHVREVHVDVDPDLMRHHGVGLNDVTRAVAASNSDVGARTLEINRVEYVVRSLGRVETPRDIEGVVLRADPGGVPLTVADVATVRLGPALRRGALDKDGAEAVGGVAVVRYGDSPMAALRAIKAELTTLATALPAKTLPDGRVSRVTVVPFYDRTQLIDETLATLESALVDQLLITVLVVLVMLGGLRASLLVSALLPAGVLLTFALMNGAGVSANVVALAGIAIAIGTMVDVGLIVVDNVSARLAEADPGTPRRQVISGAVAEVSGAVLTALATTVVSFLPVFGLQATEGKLFGPLAWTKTLALVAAAFLAVVVMPAAMTVIYGRPGGSRIRLPRWLQPAVRGVAAAVCLVLLADHWGPLGPAAGLGPQVGFVLLFAGGFLALLLGFRALYPRMLRWVLAHPVWFALLPCAVVLFGATAWLGAETTLGWLPDEMTAGARARMPGLGQGYLPNLDEGDFLFMPSTMPHASFGATLQAMRQSDARIAALPEVRHAVGKLGRAETALDPAPVSMLETVVTVWPEWSVGSDGVRRRNWRPHIRTRRDVWDAIAAAGALTELTDAPPLQPIRTRILMLQTGMRGDLGVRVRGPDVATLAAFGDDMAEVLGQVPELTGVLPERQVGKPYVEIVPDRAAIARYGLSLGDVQRVIAAAVGGAPTTELIDGRERTAVRVRYPPERRLSPEAIGDVLVSAPALGGTPVPLDALASVGFSQGPQAIKSEDTFKTSYVTFAAARLRPDRPERVPLDRAVAAAQAAIGVAIASGALTVPAGVSWELAGDWEAKARSDAALSVLIPIALAIIFVLLQLQLRSVALTLMVGSGVVVAVGGGMLALWAWGQPGFLDIDVFGQNLAETFQVGPVDLTVGVWVGFIALIGLATDDGVVMATYLKQRFATGAPSTRAGVIEAVVDAGRRRIRPCLMTTATTVLALLPVLTSTGKGADVMLPLAIPVFGGMLFELVTLFVVPVLYAGYARRRLPPQGPSSPPEGVGV